MTYRPTEAAFPPPWRVRVPSLVYLGITLVVGAVVLAADLSPTNSQLYVTIIENNSNRIVSAQTFAILLLVSSVSLALREAMRGVRVLGDGIEYRDVASFVIPRLRKFRWPQMDCIVLDQPNLIAIDLWDGTRAFLPQVLDQGRLSAVLERVALARAIPVRGGKGVDDLPDSVFDEADAPQPQDA